MNRYVFIFIALICGVNSFAQIAYSDLGDKHQLRINSNGSVGINLETNEPASFYQRDTNLPLLKQAGLWIVGKDVDGVYHTATHYLSDNNGFDFWSGPVDTLTGQTGNASKWNKVWKVTQEEIETHRTNFKKTIYTTPASIANWPAMGSENFATYLAPFIDANIDGKYNPDKGDYPDINGITATYCIFNDMQKEHSASYGPELGIEVHMMAYQLTENSPIYLEYYILNRRPTDFTDVRVGFFVDGECGNRNDNYAGTFSSYPQSIFVYNSPTAEDEFIDGTPYVLATFLNENLASTIAFNDSSSVNGRPETNQHFINYAYSLWKDSSTLQQGANGVNSGNKTEFIFSQNANNPEMWTEEQQPNNSGSRTIIGFSEPVSLAKNEFTRIFICLDAGVSSFDNIANYLEEKAAKNAQAYRSISSIPTTPKFAEFNLYPNPTSGVFHLESKTSIESVQISNYQGVEIYRKDNFKKNTWTCNIPLLPGVYIVQLTTVAGVQTKKICIRP